MKKLVERPLLWEKGADSTPEDVATPTLTTIKSQQNDGKMGSAEGQGMPSADKGNEKVSYWQIEVDEDPRKDARLTSFIPGWKI